jgi:sulfite reductase (NADPH) flavoprotein alpha-component
MNPIPSNAPFTPEQSAWLNRFLPEMTPDQLQWLSGFLAGFQCAGMRAGAMPAPATAAGAAPAKVPVTVLFGTESGNSEALADEARKELAKRGCQVTLKDMADVEPAFLEQAKNLLVIVSTWGEGDPPERAAAFYEKFMSNGTPRLNDTRFSVCGLGDTSYSEFCKMGKDFDAQLEALGGKRLAARVDCDVDYEPEFRKWLGSVVQELEKTAAPAAAPESPALYHPGIRPETAWSKANPFPATLLDRVQLNGTGSAKETYHLEFSLEGSGLTYLPGDSLGVKPRNCPDVVDQLIQAAGFKGDEEVNRGDGSAGALRGILIEELDSTVLSRKLVQEYARLTKLKKLETLIADPESLSRFCEGREIVDLFSEHPTADWTPQHLADLLRVLPPRLYSISSSQRAHPDQVHLTVGAVRYQSHGRSRKGVASTFLSDRIAPGETAPVYVHANNHFRLPEDPNRPIIMIGPGTGIAPFRAFMQERAATGAKGKSWLFFGDQHFTYDFLYQLEWQDFLKEGLLTRMDVAFSRDAPEKVYVQHRLQERARDLFEWIQEGAHIYICGDAHRMAKDVNQTLQKILAEQGGMSAEEARDYLARLSREKRYQRDVY